MGREGRRDGTERKSSSPPTQTTPMNFEKTLLNKFQS